MKQFVLRSSAGHLFSSENTSLKRLHLFLRSAQSRRKLSQTEQESNLHLLTFPLSIRLADDVMSSERKRHGSHLLGRRRPRQPPTALVTESNRDSKHPCNRRDQAGGEEPAEQIKAEDTDGGHVSSSSSSFWRAEGMGFSL